MAGNLVAKLAARKVVLLVAKSAESRVACSAALKADGTVEQRAVLWAWTTAASWAVSMVACWVDQTEPWWVAKMAGETAVLKAALKVLYWADYLVGEKVAR